MGVIFLPNSVHRSYDLDNTDWDVASLSEKSPLYSRGSTVCGVITAFHRFFDDNKRMHTMLQWVREVIIALQSDMPA